MIIFISHFKSWVCILIYALYIFVLICNSVFGNQFQYPPQDLIGCDFNRQYSPGALFFFTRGHFWPSGIVVACICLCVRPTVCVCGNHLLVRAITHYPVKLGSPNLDHRCKRPWLRSLLFFFFFFFFVFFFFWGGGGDWSWPWRYNLTSKSKVTPFWACRHDNSSPVKARVTKFGPKVCFSTKLICAVFVNI